MNRSARKARKIGGTGGLTNWTIRVYTYTMNDKLILFEDQYLIAVNKQPGVSVEGHKEGEFDLYTQMEEYLSSNTPAPQKAFCGMIHRIDRPVSGVVLFAKNEASLARMNELFRTSSVKKAYWAVVDNPPPLSRGELLHYIVTDSSKNKSFALDKPTPRAKEARMSYRLVGTSERYYLLEIHLHTGRRHQIRSQLAKVGCHIKGDLKYGFPRSNRGGGIYLHAREIGFIHPFTGTKIRIVAPPPSTPLWDLFPQD